jgi:peptidoglycan/LPS O-acetylase OafA/YrhL
VTADTAPFWPYALHAAASIAALTITLLTSAAAWRYTETRLARRRRTRQAKR